MTKPIKPSEVAQQKEKNFPSYVIDAFNELIAAKFVSGSAKVPQAEVVELILLKANKDITSEEPDGYGSSLSRDQIFDRGYLNVEEIYREQGWKVSYDKPSYYETYGAYFIFRSK